jgi:hypothetical protein
VHVAVVRQIFYIFFVPLIKTQIAACVPINLLALKVLIMRHILSGEIRRGKFFDPSVEVCIKREESDLMTSSDSEVS